MPGEVVIVFPTVRDISASRLNGRTLVFSKAKAFGIMTRVLSLGDNEGLMPGDRATFRWEKD